MSIDLRFRLVVTALAGASLVGSALAAPNWPAPVRAAVFDMCAVPTKDQPAFLAAHKPLEVDLTGDGAPEYILEVGRDASDGPLLCFNRVFGQVAGKWDQVGAFACCDYSVTGSTVTCKDTGKPVLKYQDKWPRFDRATGAAEAKAAFEKGKVALRKKQYEDARELLCDGASFVCGENLEYGNACAAAALAINDLKLAEFTLRALLAADPSYPETHKNLGALAEKKKDAAGAAEHYKKYLELSPDAKDRAAIEARLHGGAPAADALLVVEAGNCGVICDKLIQCKKGWDKKADCVAACEGAGDDRVTSRTYRCAARATSCKAISACGK